MLRQSLLEWGDSGDVPGDDQKSKVIVGMDGLRFVAGLAVLLS